MSPEEAYYVVDDVLTNSSKEGFVVMYGDPMQAVGTNQFEAKTLRECKAYLRRHTTPNEPVYRVRVARRHGKFSCKPMSVLLRS